MEYGLIIAGGAGTRLWPLSRGAQPKQLLKILRGQSLLQLSYERLRGLLPPERIFICTGDAHRDLVRENLPQLPPENLIGEPMGRDTANAIGLPAMILANRDKDAVMAVVTADHIIEPAQEFHNSLRLAFDVVRAHPASLVTFGIRPTHGHTGLGYVHRGEPLALPGGRTGAYRVQAFKEKPDKATADRYVESGRYYWNSGMFVWRCDTLLAELRQHLAPAWQGLGKIAAAWDTPRRRDILAEIYPGLPRISIDYAVMEPASQGKGKAAVVTVEMPVRWLDVGSWPALAESLDTDEHDNALSCPTCIMVDCDNNIIISSAPEHLVATIGLSDTIIVHTPDITLVCPKSEAQRVKELVTKAREKYGDRYQ